MKFTFELRYNRIMNTASAPTYEEAADSLIKTLSDPGFRRALKHPLFDEALNRVINNNDELFPRDRDGGTISELVTVLTQVCTFEVKEGDDRLFTQGVGYACDDEEQVYKVVNGKGRFVEVDEDGVEMG